MQLAHLKVAQPKPGALRLQVCLFWTVPVLVVNDNGTTGIYGDYKQTVNKLAICDNYPVPKTVDLFATLNGD